MKRFEGRTAIVTGGGGGIGEAICRRLADEGAFVRILDVRIAAAEALAAGIEAAGGHASAHDVDLRDATAIHDFVAEVSAGDQSIDVLCNNAGLMRRGSLMELAVEDWRASFAVNVDALFHMCQAVIPVMQRQGGGAIVNTASQWGLHPAPGHIAYNTTKAAVVAFTQNLARDYAPDRIRVNAVAPGEVRTPMLEGNLARSGRSLDDLNRLVPYGRIGEPEEIAALVAFLASDEAGYLCGSVVEITGAQAVAQEGAMRWSRTLQTVDVHCAGEIGRVITGGVLNIPGATMAAKLHHLNTVDDSMRRFLCSEPRSGPAGSFCLLLPACDPAADIGLIILQPDQAHAMSGSNSMCAVTALLETGMIPMTEPETVVTLDTAAGLVRARAACADGKVTRVSLDMPASFVARRNAVIETARWGPVRYDLCFGGVFYALVDAAETGLVIAPENARELAATGVALRNLIAAAEPAIHPSNPVLNGLAYVMFRAEEPDGAVRTCTTLRPGRADRSPCGTGSNANMAVRHADGRARPGDVVVSRSIIGGEFTTELIETCTVGPYPATRNRVSGQCWIYGMSQIGLDPTDPFQQGFTLSDTWGDPAASPVPASPPKTAQGQPA